MEILLDLNKPRGRTAPGPRRVVELVAHECRISFTASRIDLGVTGIRLAA